ncbi:MFS transporter (plasmid) [Deinococcus sp. KNUC1210]|uniref:MFS transporter n=1 Tax=Deinococcus sp. KNUC1210 TaxID=2917691 RepID=UPI001EF017A5|nr:MFS transporter [Deinococcus sp. KNUC1210]ULH17149.1 MFS transporter [Deinococcus sp. KNUC1210]
MDSRSQGISNRFHTAVRQAGQAYHAAVSRPHQRSSWQRTLWVMVASQFITQTAFTLGLPFLPLYIRQLGVHDAKTAALWAGISATASGLGMAFMAPIWGRMADRYGRKAMVLRATFAGVIVVGAMALVQGPVALLVLRLLQGMLTGTVSASNTMVADAVPERQLGTSMGLMQTAVFAGAAGGPLIGGLIADHFGYRLSFAATAVLLLASGLLVLFGSHERFQARTRVPVSRAERRTRTRLIWVVLAPIIVVNFLDQLAGSIVGPVLPLVIADLAGPQQHGVATLTGTILGSVAISASVGALLAGRLTARFPPQRVVALCAGGAALCALLQVFAPSVTALGVFRVVMGLFIGGTIPAANVLLGALVRSEDRGTAFGLTASATSLGFAAGPLLGALLVNVGLRAPFLLTALLLALESGWVLWALRGRRQTPAALAEQSE